MRWRGLRIGAAVAGCLAATAASAAYGAAPVALHAEPVELDGEPLDGSTDKSAPTSLVAGQWTDRLGPATGGEDTHYFSYDRVIKESTVHVGVVGVSAGSGDTLDVTVLGPAEASCGYASASASSYVPSRVFGASVSVPGRDPDGLPGDCSADTLLVTVERTYGGEEDDDLPIAIKVVEEAPAADAAELPEPAESPSYRPASEGGDPRALDGATTFGDAPLLDPVADGVAVTTDVPQGEERLYRVPVGWGQQLTVTATVAAASRELQESAGFDEPYVELELVDPTRATYSDEVSDAVPGDYYGAEPLELGTATPPVRYLNRYSSTPATVPGDYWVSVAVAPVGEGYDPVEVPVRLTVAVTGDGEGAPSYPPNVLSPDDDQVPDYRPETPFLIGDGEFAAVASGSPVVSDAGDDGGWLDVRRGAGLGLAALSLLLCALGAWRLRASR